MQGTPTPPQDANTSARKLAFTQAYHAHANFFYGYFCRKTRDPHLAEDLAQQLWESVYRNFAQHQFAHVRLLQRKAEQIFWADLKKRGVRDFVEYTDDLPEVAASAGVLEPGTEAEERDLKARFWENFPGINLTEAQKDVFWLYARVGYKIAEIAARFSLPVSTVHDWIKKVRNECAAILNQK